MKVYVIYDPLIKDVVSVCATQQMAEREVDRLNKKYVREIDASKFPIEWIDFDVIEE